jgi:hypothetical protein
VVGTAGVAFRPREVSVGDHDDGFVDVVEDDHLVVEAEAQVRDAAVVRRSVRQVFHIAHGVVGGEPDRPAAERRQAGQPRPVKLVDPLLEQLERVGVVELRHRVAHGLADAVTERLEPAERLGAEDAEPPHPLPTDHTFKQEAPAALMQLAERRHRRERVGH